MKRIVVYCGASMGNNPVYRQSAIEVGEEIVKRNFELVYGGGGNGLMGTIAKSVIAENGVVYGVIPKFLTEKERMLKDVTNLYVVEDMSTRKQKMLDLSDACLAIPGGPGTLEEIIEAYSWAILAQSSNPCAFYNVNGYYDSFEQMFDKMADEGFLSIENRNKILFSDSLNEIFNFFKEYTLPQIVEYE